jgi:FkbM family methyltransferase
MQNVTTYDELKRAPVWANMVARLTRRMPIGKFRLIRMLFQGSNERFVGRMAEELGGYEFDCCLRDWIAREVFFAGCYEAQESSFVRNILRSGMTFVDAGANWGFFTLMAAHLVGISGKVIALEPDPRIFLKLKSNVERNNLEQVQVFDVAAADRDSELILTAHDESGENWGISRLIDKVSTTQKTFRVRSRPLDSLLDDAGLEGVDLLKIDVEGAEDMVLNGMEAGLKSFRYRRILLELHPIELAERRHTIREVAEFLIARGYKGFALDYSQAAMRKAYYHPMLHFREFVRPLNLMMVEGLTSLKPVKVANTHTIWLSPGQLDLI